MTKSRGLRHPIRGSIETRFWARVVKDIDTGCWIWTASTRSDGYGQINRGGRNLGMISVHRLSWKIHFGEIPDDLHVLHRCDNKRCVNPNHLFLGTNDDNIQDRISKGRSICGENHPQHVLTKDKVEEIRRSYSAWSRESSLYALVDKYGVSVGAVYKVVKGKTWK